MARAVSGANSCRGQQPGDQQAPHPPQHRALLPWGLSGEVLCFFAAQVLVFKSRVSASDWRASKALGAREVEPAGGW